MAEGDVESRLLSLLADNPRISAITACFAPEHLPDSVVARSVDRCCPFSYSDENCELFIKRIEDSYDYTKPNGSLDKNGEPINSAGSGNCHVHGSLPVLPGFGLDYSGTQRVKPGILKSFNHILFHTGRPGRRGLPGVFLLRDICLHLVALLELHPIHVHPNERPLRRVPG